MNPRLRTRSGFTLVELLVAMTVLSVVMGIAVAVLQKQSQGFRRGAEDTDVLQNMEFAVGTLERQVRTMGANVGGSQPMLVYGSNDLLAFNADFTENVEAPVRWAVNYNPDAPDDAVSAWKVADHATLPGTTYDYPSETFALGAATSPAETILFWFTPDASTSRSDDYVLMERVNNGTAQVVTSNVLPFTGRPFLEYYIEREPADLTPASTAELPLIRRNLVAAGSAADSVAFILPDRVRAVRVNLRVTNGRTGSAERIRDISTMIEVPNNGLPQPTVCGRAPNPPATITTAPGTPGNPTNSGFVTLGWSRSPDHGAGEQDVRQYAVYKRLATETEWKDPEFTVRADTTTAYRVMIGELTPGQVYTFGVSSQDCTPQFSSILTRNETAP